ncbi:glycosyltransferase [Halobacterium salinarum]|uniref:glycosyltransferase n=1 Tax=Halobacterium TaxID=2239 RepID=UPI001963D488|nr:MULTISPECIES: glycosyltransferase [Halobacterium]MCF2165675.1 glycosyltransferase [Halobacterium salinarum]MCF2166545.1 glycosyltransferase [Halobacterium salinarum]MCF2238338.1 glycosyltransferase [Halobacterium salinarum]MDL0126795.1 glycosyltransferase [Halobacterium salinarum]MDL0140500.1 glycosyltransferase [Halobacterium salinarum]
MSGRLPTVAAFTDSYLPTVNGVTYTVSAWHTEYEARGGRMPVVYPASDHEPAETEHPVASLAFPFYDGYRMAFPSPPDAVAGADVVHAHTPFGLGLAAVRLARRNDAPLVATYHTPTAEYAEYVGPDAVTGAVRRASERYERWFLSRADLVLTPSERTRREVRALGVDTPVEAMPNGVDTDRFQPTDPTAFLAAHDLPADEPLIGYTGRHGYEKRLGDLLAAAAGVDATVVFGGDGPARDDLEAEADARGVDARFLGFLDREEMPAFYSALDVFAFPSPIETEGLVALEANACGTPVAGVDAGALSETIIDGTTGYHYDAGDIPGFRRAIRRALDDRDTLAENCVARRPDISVGRAIDRLAARYRELLG